LLNKRSCLAAALSVTEFLTAIAMILATKVRLRCSTNLSLIVTLINKRDNYLSMGLVSYLFYEQNRCASQTFELIVVFFLFNIRCLVRITPPTKGGG
jgi:hypothetical protein